MLVRLIDFRRGIRLTLYLENRVGAIAGLAEIFRKLNINIISIVAFEPVGREYEKEGNVVVRVETENIDELSSTLGNR